MFKNKYSKKYSLKGNKKYSLNSKKRIKNIARLKYIVAVLFLLTSIPLIFSFFSDTVVSSTDAASGNLHHSVTDLQIEHIEDGDWDDTNDVFVEVDEDGYTSGSMLFSDEVKTFKFVVNNIGSVAIDAELEITLVWDDDTLLEGGKIFLYPMNLLDYEIMQLLDIGLDDFSYITFDEDDTEIIETENGPKQGIRVVVNPSFILDSAIPGGEVGYSPSGESSKLFEFKLVFLQTTEVTSDPDAYNEKFLEVGINVNSKHVGNSELWSDSTHDFMSIETFAGKETLSELVRRSLNAPTNTFMCYKYNGQGFADSPTAANNYVWYSGILWRVMCINPDGTVKLVTDETISVGDYGVDTVFTGSYVSNWLNNDFYSGLYRGDNVVANHDFCNTRKAISSNDRTCPATDVMNAKVGLIETPIYNYLRALNGNGSGALQNNNFINTRERIMTMTKYDASTYTSRSLSISDTGTLIYASGTAGVTTLRGVKAVININPDIKVLSGNGYDWGGLNSPYVISPNRNIQYNKTRINQRIVGEYVKIGNYNYRIQEFFPDGGTKLILDHVVGSNIRFDSVSGSVLMNENNPNNMFNTLTNVVYPTLFITDEEKDMVAINSYYFSGEIVTSDFYENAKVQTNRYDHNLGLPKIGQMLVGNTRALRNLSINFWTASRSSATTLWKMFGTAVPAATAPTVATQGVRPCVIMKNTVVITGGTGTPVDPFTISNKADKPVIYTTISEKELPANYNFDYTSLVSLWDDMDTEEELKPNLVVTVDKAGFPTNPGEYVLTYNLTDSDGLEADPVQITIKLYEIIKIDSGFTHVLALLSNGKVYSWGDNSYGKTGLGTTSGSTTLPTQIQGLEDIVDIAGGDNMSFALKSDGTLYSWGDNSGGRTGQGVTAGNTLTPTEMDLSYFGGSKVISVSSSQYVTTALTASGHVYGWGYNLYGGLGYTSNATFTRPVPIVYSSGPLVDVPISDVVFIDQGWWHGGALTSDGRLIMWGSDLQGMLGTDQTSGLYAGTYEIIDLPAALLGNIKTVACGGYHTLIIDNNGEVWGTGLNEDGQLGLGHNTSRVYLFEKITDPNITDIVAASGGMNHSALLKSDGRVYTMGLNTNSKLGLPDTTARNIPTLVPSVSGIKLIENGQHTTFFLGGNNILKASGTNSSGQLGLGHTGSMSGQVPQVTKFWFNP